MLPLKLKGRISKDMIDYAMINKFITEEVRPSYQLPTKSRNSLIVVFNFLTKLEFVKM